MQDQIRGPERAPRRDDQSSIQAAKSFREIQVLKTLQDNPSRDARLALQQWKTEIQEQSLQRAVKVAEQLLERVTELEAAHREDQVTIAQLQSCTRTSRKMRIRHWIQARRLSQNPTTRTEADEK